MPSSRQITNNDNYLNQPPIAPPSTATIHDHLTVVGLYTTYIRYKRAPAVRVHSYYNQGPQSKALSTLSQKTARQRRQSHFSATNCRTFLRQCEQALMGVAHAQENCTGSKLEQETCTDARDQNYAL